MSLIERLIADESDESDEDDLILYHINTACEQRPLRIWTSFTDREFRALVRFEKGDFARLRDALRIPVTIRTRGRFRFDGSMALLVTLRRLAYPCRLRDVGAQFGLSESQVSECVNAVVDFIYRKWKHLLGFHASRFGPAKLQSYAALTRRCGCPIERCVGFIDGTLRPTARPTENQREIYNGHKRQHGFKFQAVVTPDGIVSHLCGPFTGNRHDITILRESGLLENLRQQLRDKDGPYCLYGDAGYALCPQLLCPYKGARITREQHRFNTTMSRIRIAVEMQFGKVLQYFAFNDYKKNLKPGLQPVALYYVVATVLTNCHTCLYGSAVTSLFQSGAPSVEEYLATR